MILPASIEHVELEHVVITPTLEVSMTWRTLAMPIGIGLMIVLALLRMLDQPRREMLQALALVAGGLRGAVAGEADADRARQAQSHHLLPGGRAADGVRRHSDRVSASAWRRSAISALATRIPTSVLVARLDAGMSHFILLSIPLFVFLGLLIEMTGMAAVMVRFLANLLGHIRGGLHYVLVAAMYLVSGISGSKAADMAAIAPALFPEMEKRGADRGDLSALLAATGAQTETIPPSLILITLGSVTGMSIAALFTGGLLPGAVLGLALCAVVWWRSRRDTRPLPARADRARDRLELRDRAAGARPAVRHPQLGHRGRGDRHRGLDHRHRLFADRRPAGLSPASTGRAFAPMLVQTASLSGAILLIVGAATAMAWAITQSGFSQNLAHAIAQVPGGRWSFIVLSILVFIVLGSVLEGLPAIVLFGPLMFPIARDVGVHEVHYAMIAILAMGVGLFAPPFGIGYYASCAIGGCEPDRALPHIWTYLAALMIGLVFVAAIPWISIGFL